MFDRDASAGEPVVYLPHIERPADEGDASTTGLDQVSDGQATTLDAVDRDGRVFGVAAEAVNQHSADAAGAQRVQPRSHVAVRCDEQPAYLLLLKQVDVHALAAGIVVGVAVENRDAVLGCLIFGAAHDIVVKRVLAVEYDESHSRRGAGPQLACGLVAHIAERFYRLHDAIDGFCGDFVRSIQHIGNRAH